MRWRRHALEHRPRHPGAPRALVVEDEGHLRRALCRALEDWGFAASSTSGGGAALQCWQAEPPDLVLLDLGLPDMDGLDVLQRARRLGLDAPVIVLTARAMIGDRILGLNFGADGYLTKPFDFHELHARVQALLRRSAAGPQRPPAPEPPPARRLGTLSWTEESFQCGGERLALTQREAALLRALLERPNQARPKQALLRAVFPYAEVRDEALEVVAFRLRRKLARCGVAVVTLRGLGYLIKESGAPS